MLMKMEMVLMVCFEMQTGKAFSNGRDFPFCLHLTPLA
jgi:hypothetical protein